MVVMWNYGGSLFGISVSAAPCSSIFACIRNRVVPAALGSLFRASSAVGFSRKKTPDTGNLDWNCGIVDTTVSGSNRDLSGAAKII